MSKGPAYPGYRAAECNGCGLCCLTVPCAISDQFGLWRDGKCRALKFRAGRYWCEAMLNPRAVSVTLSKVPKPVRDDALPHGLGCDHRAAWSLSDVFRLLTTRNIADDVAGFVGDTYPRACVYHHVDGTRWFCYLEAPDQEFTLQQVQYDRPPEAPVPLSQWCPP